MVSNVRAMIRPFESRSEVGPSVQQGSLGAPCPAAGPVRVAIAGCGNVLSAYLPLVERLRRDGQVELVALCGLEGQRAAIEAQWPGQFVSDYDRLLTRSDLDLVVVLTPMPLHAPMAAAALRAGKHVLLEKPLGVTLAEARDLVELSQDSPGHLMCAPFTFLSPTFQAIAGRIRRGDIGRVVSARGRYGWAGPDWSDWFYKAGGGALFDLGVYNLTSLTGWLGPVRRVSAMAGVAIPERVIQGRTVKVEAEDNIHVTLDFGDACLASVFAGFTLQQYRGPGLELFGTEGTIYLLGDDWDPDGYEMWQNSANCWQLFKETAPEWPWTDGLRHLVECVRKGSAPVVGPDHALHVLEVMTLAQEAARDGRARLVESSFSPPRLEAAVSASVAYRVHDRTRGE